MAGSYLRSCANAVPRAASAKASGVAAGNWHAIKSRGRIRKEALNMPEPFYQNVKQRVKPRPPPTAHADTCATERIASKQELRAELEDARAEGAVQLSKVRSRHARAECIELRVVERIESFRTELEPRVFSELECLEHCHVPVVAPRADHGVPRRSAP